MKDNILLFDLGYFKYELFSRIRDNGGYFVSRLTSISQSYHSFYSVVFERTLIGPSKNYRKGTVRAGAAVKAENLMV